MDSGKDTSHRFLGVSLLILVFGNILFLRDLVLVFNLESRK